MASSIATFFGFSSVPKVSKQDRAILESVVCPRCRRCSRNDVLESGTNLIPIKHSMKNQRDKLKVYQRKVRHYGRPNRSTATHVVTWGRRFRPY